MSPDPRAGPVYSPFPIGRHHLLINVSLTEVDMKEKTSKQKCEEHDQAIKDVRQWLKGNPMPAWTKWNAVLVAMEEDNAAFRTVEGDYLTFNGMLQGSQFPGGYPAPLQHYYCMVGQKPLPNPTEHRDIEE